jgi:prepilin-type N-terminal cleavage/methylation domain-containing protein
MRQRAFTLVELLAVIAIILVLAGILVPTIGMMRERARRSEARQTARQLQMGLETYHEEDERKRYPAEDASHELTRAILDLLLDRRLFAFPASRLRDDRLVDPWLRPYRYRLRRDATWWPDRPLEPADGNGNQPLDGDAVAGIRGWNWTWDESRAAAAWNPAVHLYGTARQMSAISGTEGGFPYVWSAGGRVDVPASDATHWQLP